MNFIPQNPVSTPEGSFAKLPIKAGVYILKDREGVPVYVGKATSIKSRVLAHLRPRYDDPVGLGLRDQISYADYIVTQTPIEALILENVLIKRYRPRYNIRLKDDKSYPYIKITSEIYPRVFVTRKMEDDGSRYFGPYGNVRAAKRSVKYLRKLFPIRSCTLPLDGVKKFKSCLDYNLGLCKAPCIFAVSKEEYGSDVKKFELFLEGRLIELSREMYAEMWKASKEQDYEKASRTRDEIRSLETTALKQRIVFPGQKSDKDIVTIARETRVVAAIVFHVREGNVVGRDKFVLEGVSQSSKNSTILGAFIKQYYGMAQALEIPDELIVPFELEDEEEVKLLLNMRKGGNQVKIFSSNHVGENKSLLKLAGENATLVLTEEESKDDVRKRERLRALKDLKEVLGLESIPRRIECYDISNIHGEEAVGAMTVFINGFPARGEYRKFKIKTVSGINDYLMIQEVIGRRFRRLLEEGNKAEPPNLVVIDGGKGQLKAAIDQMHRDGVFGIPTISLAKKEELIFVPRKAFPIRLERESEALHILQHIRDEAHRFGVTFHRQLRERKATESKLDHVEGIGERRKRNLLAHFGSIEAIKNSTPDEIASAGNLSKKVAQVILASLNQ
ncbi:MAG: excinuclease ABC subunit UvrC [Nitrososphaerales archaeon]